MGQETSSWTKVPEPQAKEGQVKIKVYPSPLICYTIDAGSRLPGIFSISLRNESSFQVAALGTAVGSLA